MLIYTLRALLTVVLRLWLKTYHRLEIRGREHLPLDRSFVLICNHQSHLDALCLLSSMPLGHVHRAFPAAAADYFFSSLPRSFLTTVFVNGLPFDRRKKGRESLELCRQILARPRHVLILFPEGTRSATGELGRFRSGIGHLVAGTPTPVVPCYLDGALAAWPKGRAFPRPRKLRLTIGPPHSFEDVAPDDRQGIRDVTARLHGAVAALSSS